MTSSLAQWRFSGEKFQDGSQCFDAKPKAKSQPTKNKGPILIWKEKVPNTELQKFSKIIEQKYQQKFDSYWDLHKWSIENFPNFWEECWNYFDIIASKPYDQVFVKTGDGFMDNEWFPGALFNFAENLLRYRDDREALICIDEDGGEEEVITYAKMYNEVRRYAAAFRKHGLQKGDSVACFMSNRKEAIFAFLAAASIGAIFGGPQPYFGTKPAVNIINKMEAKFLISIDKHAENGFQFCNIDYLAEIVSNAPFLEKVIIVATKEETLTRDLSDIPKSILLEDFLNSGNNADGTVPELVFEQLPVSHPVAINFTSGTTGLPKGPVHSAGTLISHLTSIVFYWNLRCGDTVYTCYPVGWTLWDTFVPCLAMGVKLLLYAGCPFYERNDGQTVWDIFARHKVTYSFLATVIVDKLEKMGTIPSPGLDLSNLKLLTMGGSPVKVQNYLFIKEKVKRDVFICSQYGASESFGTFSGFDLNMPCYAGEIQAPALGMDIKCFDENGVSVLNKRGEMVIAKPLLSLPVFIWKDKDHSIMKEVYLSKYPGVWCQNDEIWINPVTKGIVVIGRSDDTLKQFGERFGAGDVYFAIHDMEEIQDYICVGQAREDGETRAVLFVKMREGHSFTPEFKDKIEQKIFDELWADCVPQVILEVTGIPYNLNNKKMESTVRKIVATNQVPEVNNIKNPECLLDYLDIPELVNY